MTHPSKIFERTNEYGISRREREKLMDDVEDFLAEHCGYNRAKRITMTVELVVKGESNA